MNGVKLSAVKIIGTVVSCIVVVGCVLPSTRRAHEQHMVQAAAYKTEFDKQVPPGTSLAEVKKFLQAQDRRILNELPDWGTGQVTGQGLLELFQGKSIRWYCGQESVGLSLSFLQDKLVSTSVTSWSFDCP